MTWLWHFWTVVLLFQLPICLSSSSSSSSFSSSSSSKPRTADLFESWCQEYGKTYSSEQEKQYRHRVFEDNYDYITQHNSKGNSTYTLSLNAFADLTHHEFKAQYLGLSGSANNLIRLNRGSSSSFGTSDVFDDRDIPSSVDWRMKGAVTNVKNQGRCGAKGVDWGYRFARVMYDFIVSGVTPVVKTYSACWAFSATGAMEGINKIVTGSLVSLSEQELIDCDRHYNNGCEGGLMDSAYQFVVRNNGIDTENDYPFQGQDGACNTNKLKRRVVTIDGYRDVPVGNEKALLKAVAAQPVSVGICGSERAFQLYSGGIFTGPCSTSLDHAVLIVGYDSHDGVDYWIVKNSWGTSWGIKGYVYMARSNGNSEGVCGINMLASYPVKTSPNPPSPPSPGPVKCNLFTSCSGGETCCCFRQLLGFCLTWKCCELESAVCCKDHRHCCPQDYPICDTERNLCLMETGNTTLVKPFKNQGLPGKRGNWNSLCQDWIL